MTVYRLKLSENQIVEVGNESGQTSITNEITKGGSHSRSENSFTTGQFTEPPQYADIPGGIVIVLSTTAGERQVRVRGGETSTGEFGFDRNDLRPFPD